MNTMQLMCFLTVAETLNFARAAEQLNVTQPAVTQQIRSLEDELNVKLFNRTTRTVTLTRAGLMFMSDAKNVIEILERAKRRGKDSFEDTRTPFVIGCHTHYEIYGFSGVLERMNILFPDIYPVFQVIPFRHLYQKLAEESIDAVISFRESGLKKYISYKEITKIPIVAVMRKDCDLSKKSIISMDDLSDRKIIATEPWRCPDALIRIQNKALEDKSALDVYICESLESSLVLARAGYGIALVPDVFSIKDDALSYQAVEDAEDISYGVYYKKLSGNPRLKEFINISKELCPW